MEYALTFDAGITAVSVARALEDIGDTVVRDAHMRATTRTAESARTQIRRDLSAETGVTAKILNRRFRLHRANHTNPNARLFIGTVPVRAYDLGAKQLKSGVSHRGPGGRVRLRSAFVATMKSGHTGVFERKTKARLPIKEVTVSIHASAKRHADAFLRSRARTEYDKVFRHEMQRRISQRVSRL